MTATDIEGVPVSEEAVRLLSVGRTALSQAEQLLTYDGGLVDKTVLGGLGELLDRLDAVIVAVEPSGDRYDTIVKATQSAPSGGRSTS